MKRTKKPSDPKSKFTKKQKLIAGSVVLLVLVVTGIVWSSRATDTSAELSNSSTASGSTSVSKDDETSAPVEQSTSESTAQNSSSTPSSPKESERQAPPAPTPAELCAKQTYALASDGTLSCTYTINVTHVPARVVVYAVETAPTFIQLYEQVTYNVACAQPAACSNNSWTTPGRAEFVVSEPTTVNVAVKQKSAYGSPTTNYTFQDWSLSEGGTNYGDGSYPYTLLGKFTADR